MQYLEIYQDQTRPKNKDLYLNELLSLDQKQKLELKETQYKKVKIMKK